MVRKVMSVVDYPSIGGVLTFSLNLNEIFVGTDIEYNVVVFGHGNSAFQTMVNQSGVNVVSLDRPKTIFLPFRFRELLAESKPAVVQVHGYYSTFAAITARLLIRKRDRPTIVATLHGVAYRDGTVALRARRALEDFCRRRADLITCVDSTSAQYLNERGLRPDLVQSNYPMPDAICAVCRNVAANRTAKGRGKPVVVGYVGRFSTEKGVDLLPEIFESLSRRGREFSVVVQGTGEKTAFIEGICSVAKTSRLAEGPPAWNHIDILVVPSMTEGSPFIVGEAVLNGVKVVATEVGDIASWCQSGLVQVSHRSSEAIAESIYRAMDEHSVSCHCQLLQQKRTEFISSYRDFFASILSGFRFQSFVD